MEFLPRAPDPEEIVIEGEEDATEDKEKGDKEKGGGDTVVDELVRNIQSQNIDETLDQGSA